MTLVLALACRSGHVAPVAPGPDVAAAAEAIALCLHWMGEEAYDDERGLEIQAGFERDCPVAAAEARAAWSGLVAVPEYALLLVDLVDTLGGAHGLPADAPPDLCASAAKHVAAQLLTRPDWRYFPAFGQLCPAEATAACGDDRCR